MLSCEELLAPFPEGRLQPDDSLRAAKSFVRLKALRRVSKLKRPELLKLAGR